MGRNAPPDFSNKAYWEKRFDKETSFEWLARSEVVLPIIARQVDSLPTSPPSDGPSSTTDQSSTSATNGLHPLRILHFGCGSSNLGPEIQSYLSIRGVDVKVIDADYVLPSLLADRSVPVFQLDTLDLADLRRMTKEQGGQWDLIVDKSTADAISCGPSLPVVSSDLSNCGIASVADDRFVNVIEFGNSRLIEPIQVLCDNLAQVSRPGARWISISYSSSRFAHLSTGAHGWTVIEKIPLYASASAEDDPTSGQETKTSGRVVYEPETPNWAYILERR